MIETILNAALEAMDGEARSLEDFVEIQKRLAGSVRERDWSGMESVLADLDAAARLVSATESSRHATWDRLADALGRPRDEPASSLALRAPEPWRSALADARRRLRVAAMRSRVENDALAAWTEASGSVLEGILQELYPDRRGRIYGPHGRARQAAERPVVLDAAF